MLSFLAPFATRIFGGLSLALALALGVLAMQYTATVHRLEKEQAAHKATVAGYRAAQAQATADAYAAKVAEEVRTRALQEKFDHDLAQARATAGALADNYIAAHGVQYGQALGSAPGGANLPGTAPAAPVTNGPGAGAVVVGADDIKICTDNTVRLLNGHAWALEPPHPLQRRP